MQQYIVLHSQHIACSNNMWYAVCDKSAERRMLDLREEIFCPICAAAGIRRKLMEVDSAAKGVVYPYCKGCKKNVRIELPLKK